MNIPQIQITTQMAQIQIQQNPGKQQLRQPKAELSIQQPKAQLSINKTPSKLSIDQTQAWEDLNLMNILKRNELFAQEGYNGWLEGIGRRAEQGRELMEIENKQNIIAKQAFENGYEPMKALGITFIPSRFAVKTNYQPAEIHIDVKINQPVIDSEIHKPEHIYERGSVDIRMKQYQAIEISVYV